MSIKINIISSPCIRQAHQHHIFFIGFMGVGKSTMAHNLAQIFSKRRVDTDRLIAQYHQKSIDELLGLYGLQGFQHLETRALHRLETDRNLLVSTGGFIIDNDSNVALMHKLGSVVLLDASFEHAWGQIHSIQQRPMLYNKEVALQHFMARQNKYRDIADIVINVEGKSFQAAAYDAGEILWKRGLL